jgi:hypothetical protein
MTSFASVDRLLDDAWIAIASFLTHDELRQLSLTSHHIGDIAVSNAVWERLPQRDFSASVVHAAAQPPLCWIPAGGLPHATRARQFMHFYYRLLRTAPLSHAQPVSSRATSTIEDPRVTVHDRQHFIAPPLLKADITQRMKDVDSCYTTQPPQSALAHVRAILMPPVDCPGAAKTLGECLRFSLEEPLRHRPRVHHSAAVMYGFIDRKVEPQLARLWTCRDAKDACRRLLQSILIFAGMWALAAVERYLINQNNNLRVVRGTNTTTYAPPRPVSFWIFMPIVLSGILVAFATFTRLLFPTALTISAAAVTDGVLTLIMHCHSLRRACSRIVLVFALVVHELIDSMPMTLIALGHILWRLHAAGSSRGRCFLHYGLLVLALAVMPEIAARMLRPMAMGYLICFLQSTMQPQWRLTMILRMSLFLHVLATALYDLYTVVVPGGSFLEAVVPTSTSIVGLVIVFTAACARQEIYSQPLSTVPRTLLECLWSSTNCTQALNLFVDVILVGLPIVGVISIELGGYAAACDTVLVALAHGFFALALSALRCGTYHFLKWIQSTV